MIQLENGKSLTHNQQSIKYTKGLVCTFADNPLRTFFFEVDEEHREFYTDVCNLYNLEELDFIVHRTGGGGYHFISPTMISLGRWKALHEELKHINTECPMITLRMQPNKHPNEEQVWYNSHVEKFNTIPSQNNLQMCNYLNKIFGSDFKGTGAGEIRIVDYPLRVKTP
jgi:hypothetical protein